MPGRPRSFDRDHAVAVALEAFWRDGYEATSIADLTGAIGISPPSLYAAFGDKQGLLDEAIACYTRSFGAGLDVAFAAPTAREAVADLLIRSALAHTDPATPPGCFVLSDPHLEAERDRLRLALAGRIGRGQHDGDVPAQADPEALAAFLTAAMVGMSARARDGVGREELLAVAELAVTVL